MRVAASMAMAAAAADHIRRHRDACIQRARSLKKEGRAAFVELLVKRARALNRDLIQSTRPIP